MQLKHLPTGIVVKCQATRSRDINRKKARGLLAERLDELRNGDGARSVVAGKLAKKKADSANKKKRRKYNRIQPQLGDEEEEEEEEEEAGAMMVQEGEEGGELL